MSTAINAAVIYHSATGNVDQLAEAAVEGVKKAGAEARLRKVPELAPDVAISGNDAWKAHVEAITDVATAEVDDLVWAEGKLADKVYTAFTSSKTPHGGQESTLISFYTTLYHWGGIVVPPGYTDPIQFQSGNPYGASHVSGGGDFPGETELEAASYQARRAVEVAAALHKGQAA